MQSRIGLILLFLLCLAAILLGLALTQNVSAQGRLSAPQIGRTPVAL